MNENSNILLMLLKHHSGQLTTEQDSAVVELLCRDREAESIWKRLQLALRETGNGSKPDEFDQSHSLKDAKFSDEFSAEMIAAFVEGKLPAKTAQQVERICLENDDLMQQVVSAFVFTQRDAQFNNTLQYQNHELSQRLENLVEWTGKSTDVSMQQAAKRSTVSFYQRLEYKLIAWSAVAAAVLALFWTGVYVLIREDQQVAKPDKDRVEQREENNKSNQSKLVENQDDQKKTPQEVPLDIKGATDGKQELIVEDSIKFPRFPENQQVVVPDSGKEEMKEEELVKPQIEIVQQPVEEKHERLEPEWTRIEGLVAGQTVGDDSPYPRWYGVKNKNLESTGRFATLPDSWASAKIADVGEIVLDSETQVELAANSESKSSLEVRIDRGRFALKNLKPGLAVSVEVGNHQWEFKNGTEPATVAADTYKGNPRLLVREGSVSIEDELIKKNQQLVRDIPNQKSVKNKVLGNVLWVTKPQKSNRANQKTLDGLLTSNDLMKDIRELRQSKSPALRMLGVKYGFALAPESDVFNVLNSDNKQLQQVGFKWLINSDISDVQVKRAWRGIAEQTDDPETVFAIITWVKMAKQAERVPLEHAQKMVSMLESDEFVFRYAATYFLDLAFGNRSGYDPSGPLPQRTITAKRWANQVSQVYFPPKPPKHREGPSPPPRRKR